MVESIVNFRDCGGLPSSFGGTVQSDRLYRSGAVGSVDPVDIDRLLGLDFALVADLRYAGERDDEPSPWPVDYADRIIFHTGDRSTEAPHLAPLRDGSLDEAGSDRIYLEFYRDLPFDRHYKPLFSRVLSALPDVDGRVLVHCSAGKDRTGMLVALILHALGVPREAIIDDFMRSSRAPGLIALAEPAAERMSRKFGVPVLLKLMHHLLDVQPLYLTSFFDEIEKRAGSLDTYLDTLGLVADRRALLRDNLLSA